MPGTATPPFTVLIPARMASSRLPDKPLLDIGGIPMVVRVARQALAGEAGRVVVASDDTRIADACRQHGIEHVMTLTGHPSGSDRLAEAVTLLALEDDAIVVNVQGDEPFMPPALIARTAAQLARSPTAVMATAAHPIATWAELQNPNIVKVVLNGQGFAQYFSRAPVPWCRAAPQQQWWELAADDTAPPPPLRHIGIYSYRAGFLKRFPALTPAPTEQIESLEQLRVLWHGHSIAVLLTRQAPPNGIDTPEDLAAARLLLQTQKQAQA